MGKTNRRERTEGRRFKKLKGQTNNRRKDRKSRAALSNFVSFRSQRSSQRSGVPKLDLDSLELARDADGNVKTFDTVEELLKDLHEPDDQEKPRRT